jgi:hypothetical protein
MNKLLEELQSRQTDSLWSYKWWLDMQLNKLAMITGLALVKAEDPIPDHVPTLDERNERDYQSAYAQVEREWRRDVGLHDYQPVFAQVCAVMNLIGVEHLNHEYNRGDPSTQTQPIGMPSKVIARYIEDYAPSSNADDADDVFGAADARETFVDMMRARKMQDMVDYADRVVDLVNATRERLDPLSEDAELEWLPKMVIAACQGQLRRSKANLLKRKITKDEAILERDEVLAIQAHAV